MAGGCQATIQKRHRRRLFTHPRELARSKCWFRRPESGQGGWQVARSSKPTLSDVAARAGVSATTASYILNGRTLEMRISSDTEQRVRRAATELGYRPNRSARNLRTASTATIGMISDFIAGGHVRQPAADRGQRGGPASSTTCVVIGESGGDPDLESPSHRGDDRPSGRRDHLRHARTRGRGHGAPRPVRPAGRAAQLRRPADRPPVGDARRRDGRPGRGPGPARTRASTRRSTSSARTRTTRCVAGPARLDGVAADLGEAGLELARRGAVRRGR